MKIIVFVVLVSALFVDCRHVNHKTHKKHSKEDKATKKEEINTAVKSNKQLGIGLFGKEQMQPFTSGLPSSNPYSCCQSTNPPSCCNGMQVPVQQPVMMPPVMVPGMAQTMNQPIYMQQPVAPMHPGAYHVAQAPPAGCCHSPYPINHPANSASHSITIQGCCTTTQPEQLAPQNTASCCQQPNAPPCCLHLRMKAGEQKNITVNNNGNNYVLHVKLIHGGSTLPTPSTTQPTSASSSGPTSKSPSLSSYGSTKPTSPGSSSGPTSPSSSSLPSTGAPTPKPNFSECQAKALTQHNSKRSTHNSPDMTLDTELNNAAQNYANKLAQDKAVKHSTNADRPGQGENLAMKCSSPDKGFDCAEAVDMWYKEVQNYDFAVPGYSASTGHFTQLVWKASTSLGIGKASYEKNGMTCWVVVGRYKDAGNTAGKFPENVERGSFKASGA